MSGGDNANPAESHPTITKTTTTTTIATTGAGSTACAGSTSEQQQDHQSDSSDSCFDWPPLESNPQVMSDYLHQIGLSESFATGDVYGFDEDLLALVPQPVYAVIVAFERTTSSNNEKNEALAGDVNVSIPFYMKQAGTLDNACGIVACLHAILNVSVSTTTSKEEEQPHPSMMIVSDSVLAQFQAATANQTPQERCQELEQNLNFRTVHQNFAQQGQSQVILRDQSQVKCHYVAFVIWNKQLIELDGTAGGPRVASNDCTDVLRGSIAEIQKRLAAGQITEQLSMMTLNAASDMQM